MRFVRITTLQVALDNMITNPGSDKCYEIGPDHIIRLDSIVDIEECKFKVTDGNQVKDISGVKIFLDTGDIYAVTASIDSIWDQVSGMEESEE